MSESIELGELDFAPAGLSQGIATPWARYWAKSLDLSIASALVFALWLGFIFVAARTPGLLAFAIAIVNGSQSGGAAPQVPQFAWSLVFFVFALGLDACIQAVFGNTLGLKMVGARLERLDHTRVSLAECVKRNLEILIHGFWFGFLAFIPLALNYRKAARGELMVWDKTFQTRIFNYRGNIWRTTLCGALALVLVSAWVALDAGLGG